MKQRLIIVVFLLGIAAAVASGHGLPVFGEVEPDDTPGGFIGYHPNHIVVKFSEDFLEGVTQDRQTASISAPELDVLVRQLKIKNIKQLFRGRPSDSDLGKYFIISFAGQTNLEEALELVRDEEFVESAEPDPVFLASVVPNDPGFSLQWHHLQQDDHDLDSPEEWDDGTGDTTVLVGITDTGVLYDHPDLSANIWTNYAEFYGQPDFDDDGNGYIDDIRGWDFVEELSNAWPGEDGNQADNDPRDFNGHGTHISGVIAAVTNNGTGVAGIAGGWSPAAGVSIVPLRIGGSVESFSGAEVAVIVLSYAAAAFDYAVLMGVDILNCSWGSTDLEAFVEALDNALNAGITVCSSAGNRNEPAVGFFGHYLATREEVITVAALDSNDVKATFSNFGPNVEISAPGVDIYSTFSDHGTATYRLLSGTSMAAPMVGGTVALLKSSYPGYSETDIREILQQTSDDIYTVNVDFLAALGAGRVNAHKAVDYMHFFPDPPEDQYESGSKTDTVSGYPVVTTIYTASPLIKTFGGYFGQLLYKVDDGMWAFTFLEDIGDNRYRGFIPRQSPGSTVYYKFSARNSFGSKTSAELQFSVLLPPDITYDPALFEKIVPVSGVEAETLIIGNIGSGTLNYSLAVTKSQATYSKLRPSPIADLVEQINARVDEASIPTEVKTIRGDVVTVRPRARAKAAWVRFSKSPAPPLDVAILGSEDYYDPFCLEDIQNKLLGTSRFNSVTVINTSVAIVSHQDLQVFDAVLVHVNYPLVDPDGLGDALADFSDIGGGVVLTTNCYLYYRDISPEHPYSIGGRFFTGDYKVIKQHGVFEHCAWHGCSNEQLGTIHEPYHPLLAGVTSFHGGVYSDHYEVELSGLEAGAVAIAEWTTGWIFAAARKLPGNNFNRIDLNFYPVSGDAFPGQWLSSTDGDLLMANALVFATNPWILLSESCGTLDALAEDTITVQCYAPDTLGEFSATIHISSNSPYEELVEVPVTMTVPGTIVYSPASADQWCNGHVETISWHYYPSDLDSLRLFFSANNGVDYHYISSIAGVAGNQDWTVASYWTDEAVVKVVAFDGSAGYAGVSDNFVLRSHGDVNCDHAIDIEDVVYLVNYIYKSGPPPCILEAGDVDGDGDGDADEQDLGYLITYLFRSGPPPICFPE